MIISQKAVDLIVREEVLKHRRHYHQFGIPLIVLIVRAAYEPRWQYP